MPTSQTGILGLGEDGKTGKITNWGAAVTPDPSQTIVTPTAQQLAPGTLLQGLGLPAFCTAVTLAAQTAAIASQTFWYVPTSGTYLVAYNLIVTSVAATGNTVNTALTYWANAGAGPGVGIATTMFGSATQSNQLGLSVSGQWLVVGAASTSAGGTTDSALKLSVVQLAGGSMPAYTLNLAVLRLS